MTQHARVRRLTRLVCAVTLFANNAIALGQSANNSTAAEPAKPAAADTARMVDARDIKIDGRPTRGAKDAKVTILFFDDFECPYSAQLYKTLLDDVMKEYGDRVKLVPLDTPRWRIHPWATRAAVNANCLAAQSNDAYWEFSGYVHEHQDEIDGNGVLAALDKLALDYGERYRLDSGALLECIQAQSDASVKESLKKANDAGVTAVPVLLINNQRLVGAVPAQDVRHLIDYVLRRVGQPASLASPTTRPATQPGVKAGGTAAGSTTQAPSGSDSDLLDTTRRTDTSHTDVSAHGTAHERVTPTSVSSRK